MAHWSQPQWLLQAGLWIQFSTVFPCPTYIPLTEPMIPHLVAHLADPSQTILVTIRSLTFHSFIFLVTLKIYHEIDLLIFSLSIEFFITLKSLMVTGCWSWQGKPKSESFHLSQIFSNHCHGRSISYSLNHYWHTYILFMWKSVIYLKSLKWISSLILSLCCELNLYIGTVSISLTQHGSITYTHVTVFFIKVILKLL